MKSLICRVLFMVCFGGAGHLMLNTDMYAEAVLLLFAGLAAALYDVATDKPKQQEANKSGN